MRSVALCLCLVLALVPSDLSAQVRTWTAVVDTVGSAPRITSPGYTAWRDTTTGWVMRHERTFPVRAHDPALPMSRRQLLLLSDKRTVVASAMPAAVEVYDSTGAYTHQIGLAGNGPGEYLMPTGLAMLHDTLLVLDSRQMRILFYTLDGRYLRTFFTGVGGGDERDCGGPGRADQTGTEPRHPRQSAAGALDVLPSRRKTLRLDRGIEQAAAARLDLSPTRPQHGAGRSIPGQFSIRLPAQRPPSARRHRPI
ncbi:MAG: 6-bladed beta-propeller [Gemmatimonadales bacterium]|nr:6-bladed beta-propeller [Gemmatimonadales bacterium]MDZ4391272.1 6-bladed beta-propeller [Gemmatimonadales bacterium]